MPILLMILALVSPLAYAKYQACTVTINSSQEADTFKQMLNPGDFDFTELTDYSDKETGEDGWFDKACQKGVSCDLLIISGHFGGDFFGMRKLGLQLSDMDRNSCQHRCDGIVNQPKEVYLFGCNTLSGKNTEHRSPQQILATQLRDGIDRADAERNTAALFSPFGSTFRQRMEAIFAGVPKIYGFYAIAPSGASVRASLKEYLSKIGNFKTHLDNLRADSETRTWLNSMRHYNVTATRGVLATDAAYSIKANSCSLGDESQFLSERTRLAFNLLNQDSNLYLPAVSRFVNTNFGHIEKHTQGAQDIGATTAVLAAINGRSDLRTIFYDALNSKGMTDSIRVDLLKSVHAIGWMSDEEFFVEIKRLFDPRIEKPSTDGADFVCSQVKENPDFIDVGDLSPLANYAFTDAASFITASCLKITDPAIADKALASFYDGHTHFRAGDLEMVLAWLKSLPSFNELRAASIHAVNEKAHHLLLHRTRRVLVRPHLHRHNGRH